MSLKIFNQIADAQDQIGPCDWCGEPIEAGEEFWSEFTFDKFCCSKTCLDNVLEGMEAPEPEPPDEDWVFSGPLSGDGGHWIKRTWY